MRCLRRERAIKDRLVIELAARSRATRRAFIRNRTAGNIFSTTETVAGTQAKIVSQHFQTDRRCSAAQVIFPPGLERLLRASRVFA